MNDRAMNGPGGDFKRRRLSALAKINLIGDDSAIAVLGQVTEMATELLPASLGSFAMLIDSYGNFDVAASTVSDAAVGDPAALAILRDEATDVICKTLDAMIVGSLSESEIGPAGGALAVQAFIGVPIEMEGRCLGVLYVLDDGNRRYTPEDVDFLELLAGRAAAAVYHSGIFAEMRSARERSEALAWVANAVIAASSLDEVLEAVVEGVAAAVAADEAEIITVDRSKARIIQYARAGLAHIEPDISTLDGAAGTAVRESRVIISADGEVPSIVAPLGTGAEILGALSVQRPSSQFTDDEIDLVVAMANQVAIAIDNVRLLDTTRSALRETEAMYGMARELVSAADLPELMAAVAKGTVEALPAAGARVLMADATELTAQEVAGAVTEMTLTEILDGGIGRVLSTAEIVSEPRALVVPLRVHGRLLGALEAVNPSDGPAFSEHQLDTLLAAAAQAAVAIENHLLFGEVQRLAITDELTGVNTRRHLFELGQREFAQSVRFRKPLSAIMFDLDHFKEINDTLGHLVGDEVLAGVADRCVRVLREIDILGRYGGEEFAVILPDALLEDAVTVAERVRRSIAEEPVETARGPVAVTVSVGVAQIGPGVLDLKSLLDQADAAMYAAKAAGRDRVMAA